MNKQELQTAFDKLKQDRYSEAQGYREEISVLNGKCNKYEERMESAESHVNVLTELKAKLEGEIYGLRNPVGTTLEDTWPCRDIENPPYHQCNIAH